MNKSICLLLFASTLLQPLASGAQEGTAEIQPQHLVSTDRANFGEIYNFDIAIHAAVERLGGRKGTLNGFELALRIDFLGLLGSNGAVPAMSARADEQDLPVWVSRAPVDAAYEAVLDENRKKIHINGIPLVQFRGNLAFGNLFINSSMPMHEADSLGLGRFAFKPYLPGTYKLLITLYKKGKPKEVVATIERRVTFVCADYSADIELETDRLMQSVTTNIPLVDALFYAGGAQPAFADTETDRIFRALLAGRLATAEPAPARIELIGFNDPLGAPAIGPEASTRTTRQRIAHAANFIKSILPAGIHIEEATSFSPESNPALYRRFIRTDTSGGPKLRQFKAQENRVVIVRTEPDDLLMHPLSIKQAAHHDSLRLRIRLYELGKSVLAQRLLRGRLTVFARPAQSDQPVISRSLTETELQQLEQDQLSLALPLDDLTESGEYVLKASLETYCCGKAILYRDFRLEKEEQQLLEIFALSPFDDASFIYPADTLRLQAFAQNLLDALRQRKAMTEAGFLPLLKIYVTGHTDVIELSRNHNLRLSFMRAENTRRLLLRSLARAASASEMYILPDPSIPETLIEGTFIYLSQAMRGEIESGDFTGNEQMRTFYRELLRNPAVMEGEIADLLASYYDQAKSISQEVIRPMNRNLLRSRVDPDGIRALSRVRLYRKGEPVGVIDLFAAGFDAAFPFYLPLDRRNEVIQRIFRAGGWQGELPAALVGDDASPAGRLINRRVEASVSWAAIREESLTELVR